MPIYRTALTSNFTQISNDLINSTIPLEPKAILLYLLSKPLDWQPKAHDIQKQLGLTAYKVRKGLRWLCASGYAAYIRLKSGHTIWQIFDKPNLQHPEETAVSPVLIPRVEFANTANKPVLINTETEIINKPLPAPPMSVQESIVVVDELIYPVQLNPGQKKAAKHIIKKVKAPELQQEVLFALAYAMTQNKVKSAPAYLQGLVTRANNGTFESVQAATATKPDTRHIDRTQELLKAQREIKRSTPDIAKLGIAGFTAALRGAL
jgi:hypothetical protein